MGFALPRSAIVDAAASSSTKVSGVCGLDRLGCGDFDYYGYICIRVGCMVASGATWYWDFASGEILHGAADQGSCNCILVLIASVHVFDLT